MRVHAASTQPQFWRHIKPIVEALPDDIRGSSLSGAHERIPRSFPADDVFLVGGYGDIARVGDRRVIYVEHGAGQTYAKGRASVRSHYPGGSHPENVIGYICPNSVVAGSWRGKPTVVVGCPALDNIEMNWTYQNAVVITFHWDAPRVAPEARSARPHYFDHLHEIVRWVRDTTSYDGLAVLGHWHPRDRHARRIWETLGVECEPDPDKALSRAKLVIADNTSFAYEAAFLGIPNIALNAPWYRREIEHGLRFWSHPPGVMVDDADSLMAKDLDAYLYQDEITAAARARAYDNIPQGVGVKLAVEFIQRLVA